MKICLVLAVVVSTNALQHSAMWSLNDADQGGGWATLTFDVANTTQIDTNYKNGIRALYPISWTQSQDHLCYAPVPHTRTTPNGSFACVEMDPNWETTWKSTLAEIKAQIDSGAIIGIFLGDEHLYFGVQVQNVKTIADQIRKDFPNSRAQNPSEIEALFFRGKGSNHNELGWVKAIIYMNEAPDVAMCNYRKDNTTIFEEHECFPQNVDWFGFDYYAHDSASWEAPKEAYRTQVYPRFSRADQRVVPTSLGYDAGNLTAAAASSLDTFCAENARQFLQFGLEDNRVVGLFPFYWSSGRCTRHPDGSVNGPGCGPGIRELPKCAATYKAIGELIIAAGAEGTSNDPVHNPPAPGDTAEPKCLTPLSPTPSTWEWCSRQ